MRTAALAFGFLLLLGAHAVPTHAQQSDSTYTVQDGDTLYGIAQKVGASVRSLMAWNDLDEPSIQVGQTLRTRPPANADSAAPFADPDTADTTASDTRTAPADSAASDTGVVAATDSTVADTTAAVASDTSASVPRTGAAADTTAPDTSTSPAASPAASDTGAATAAHSSPAADAPRPYGRYTVTTGDTFITLALRLGMPADSLFALNDSTTASLTPDSTLRLPPRFSPPRHTVEEGQTLYSIAGEYGVSVRSLTAANAKIDPDSLQPGQRLLIPGRRGEEIPPPGTWGAPDTTGRVARYPEAFSGRLTASGTAYDPADLVISHPSLPFNSVVLLATPDDKHQTFARVIDRGPIEDGTLLDVSDAIADELALGTDAPSVSLRVVWRNRNSN